MQVVSKRHEQDLILSYLGLFPPGLLHCEIFEHLNINSSYKCDKLRLDMTIILRPNNGFTLNYIYGFCDSSKHLWICH